MKAGSRLCWRTATSCGEDRRQLVLGGRHLVVLCLGEDAELPQLLVQVAHIVGNAGFDGAEVVVVQLLTLGRLCAEQCSAGQLQILALLIYLSVDQKILLLGSHGSDDARDVGSADQVEDLDRFAAQALHRTQQRRLFVEHLAGVGTKRGGDIKRTVLDKRRRSGVPCGVAARFKGGADAAARERGRVGLALDQLLAGKLHDHAVAVRLEPVGIMGAAHLDSPVLHCRSHHICHADIQRFAVADGFFQRLVGGLWQSLLHFFVSEYIASEHFWYL